MSNHHFELIGPKTAFDAAVEESEAIWHDPASAPAREEYWMTGDTPESGFCDSLEIYLQAKYGLSPFDSGRAAARGLGGPPLEVVEGTRDVIAIIKEHNDD